MTPRVDQPIGQHTPGPRARDTRHAAAALALTLTVALATTAGCGSDPGSGINADANSVDGPNATVERVVDGDTIIADVSGTRERIRLIGIDTPESVDPRQPVECFGDEAKEYLTNLLPPGEPIRLELDEEPRDQYDRLLAYVIRTDGDRFINLDLLETGHATTLNIEPNDAHASAFRQAESAARADGLGLWTSCPSSS